MRRPRIAITPGEPAGIGPDLVLQFLAQPAIPAADIVVFADPDLLTQRAAQLGISIQLHLGSAPPPPGELQVRPVALRGPVQGGQLNPVNAYYVLETLQKACQACQDNDLDALVTGPVHKGIMNEAGIPFRGHTELLAQQTGVEEVVMMLATHKLKVALVTTHLPLTQVSAAITPAKLERVIRILEGDLKVKFGLPNPHILVCGLNPHAGEGGHLGQEEIVTIIPVLNQLRREGLCLTGPVAADTAFTPASLKGVDVVLAMYHDQGLPVLKAQGFGEAVNVTLGLPILRTSVDHGTALALAGTGRASHQSLDQAVQMAIMMVNSTLITL